MQPNVLSCKKEQAKCGRCMYLIPRLRLCTNPLYKNLPVKLLEKSGTGFYRRTECKAVAKILKGNKFHAEKVITADDTYDSKDEYKRFLQLAIAQKAGAIKNLSHHTKYVLISKSKYGRDCYYEADFVYNKVPSGELVVEDVKCAATKTKLYAWKKRLVAEQYGIIIQEVYL